MSVTVIEKKILSKYATTFFFVLKFSCSCLAQTWSQWVDFKESTELNCRRASFNCADKTGYSDCYEKNLNASFLALSTEDVKRNVENRFNKFIKADNIKNKCCGDNQACLENLQRTQLEIDLNDISGSEFYATSRTVHISGRDVYGCLTDSCLDGIILHEIGHACQVAYILDQSLSNTVFGDLESLACSAPETYEDFKKHPANYGIRRILDESAMQCLFANFKPVYENKKLLNEPACFGNWIKESFADLFYIFENDDQDFFAYLCNGKTDSNHPPLGSYLPCLKYFN